MNPDLVLEVPEWDTPPADLEERAWRALYEVPDPEFPISLVDLGLVYGVAVHESDAVPADARVEVAITLTATACPCVEFIKWDVRDRLLQEAGRRRGGGSHHLGSSLDDGSHQRPGPGSPQASRSVDLRTV